jgi:predicted GNAT family acetyltransferase
VRDQHPPTTDHPIVDAVDRGRYEAHVDGETAGFLEYVIKYGRLALIHTEVRREYAGQRLGSKLIRFALDDARHRGLKVIAVCPYVQDYLTRHPQDDDIVIGRGQPT